MNEQYQSFKRKKKQRYEVSQGEKDSAKLKKKFHLLKS